MLLNEWIILIETLTEREGERERERERTREHCKPDFMSALAHPLLSVQQF